MYYLYSLSQSGDFGIINVAGLVEAPIKMQVGFETMYGAALIMNHPRKTYVPEELLQKLEEGIFVCLRKKVVWRVCSSYVTFWCPWVLLVKYFVCELANTDGYIRGRDSQGCTSRVFGLSENDLDAPPPSPQTVYASSRHNFVRYYSRSLCSSDDELTWIKIVPPYNLSLESTWREWKEVVYESGVSYFFPFFDDIRLMSHFT